ncbi:hypothetical protein ABIA39_001957 [Nocardia sp. GAS34]
MPGGPYPGRPRGTRRPRGGRALVAGYAALGCLLTACGSTVPGHPAAEVRSSAVARQAATDLASMLPTQAQFPSSYQTAVLSSEEATRAAADLTGIPDGVTTVTPAGCATASPSDPNAVAIVVGTDDDTRATITVELTRAAEPLARLHAQLRRCGTVRAQHGPIANTVVTQLDPPPPVNADDSLAWSRTVSGQQRGPGLDRSMRTLAAQLGDVRITATYLSFGDGTPDMEGLDQVFTAAVADVRKG